LLFIALDIGTSTIKISLFDEKGNLLALTNKESPLYIDNNIVEHDAESCWQQVINGIREVVSIAEAPIHNVIGLSIASQGQTFLPVDKNGNPMRRAIVWLDKRAIPEKESIWQNFGQDELYRHTGLPTLTPGNMACVLLWLRNNEPEIFLSAYKFLHISDFIVYKLTRRFVAEIPVYSCMGIFDITIGDWWSQMLDFINLTTDQLPYLINSGVSVSRLSHEAAQITGLSTDTIVVSGTLDVSATVLGSNTLSSDRIALSLGTTLQTNLTIRQFNPNPARYLLWIFGHVIPRAHVGVLWRETAGFTLRWFRDMFCAQEKRLAAQIDKDIYDLLTELAADKPPGSDKLLVLPHLQGTQLPESYPGFRGIFYGVSPNHDKGHFIRAILEGVGYTLRENIEIYNQMGLPCKEVWATGGGAKSQLWNQINADITGCPQFLLKCNEASSLGAAILAAVGTGVYTNINEACDQMVQPAGVCLPNHNNRNVYESGYQLYKKLYQQTKVLFIN